MTVSESYLREIVLCFSREVARRIVELRPNARIEERLDYLREKANEGSLSDKEHAEHEEFVESLDSMGSLKARAR